MDTQIGKVTKGLHPGSTMLAHQPERCPWKGREAEDYRPETNRMFLINFRWRSSSAFEDPPAHRATLGFAERTEIQVQLSEGTGEGIPVYS